MRQHNFNEFSANQKACYEMLSDLIKEIEKMMPIKEGGRG